MVSLLVGFALGEYEFTGALPIVAGLLLGAVLAELVVSIGRERSVRVGIVVGCFGAASMLGAGFIDANGVEPVKVGAYLAAAIALGVGYLRAGPPLRRR